MLHGYRDNNNELIYNDVITNDYRYNFFKDSQNFKFLKLKQNPSWYANSESIWNNEVSYDGGITFK